MNITKLLYIALLGVFVLGFGCQKELELEPQQDLSTGEALKDLNGMRTALFGAYNAMQATEYYGRNFLVMPEVEGDLVYVSVKNSNRFIANYLYQWTPDNVDIRDVWNTAYSALLRLNNIINNIDKIEGNQEEKDLLKGEALGLRALIHFDLVRTFAKPYTQSDPAVDLGVPVITQAIANDADPARNTIEEVYTQILADLSAAQTLLAGGANDPYRFSADAAEALMARVYLYQGQWAKAEEAASNLINSGNYELATDIVEAFKLPGSSEEIFTLRFVMSETNGSDNLGQIYNPDGYGDIRVTTDLIDLYEDGDQRLGFLYDLKGEIYQSKFLEQEGVHGLHSPKLLRLAEMYLIRAEARAQQGKYAEALADLNALRAARGAGELKGVADDEVLAVVLAERRRELAFEGHTKYDLWRNGLDLVRDQCNTGKELSAPCTVEMGSYLNVYPIPQREMDVNQNIEQNEGYQ